MSKKVNPDFRIDTNGMVYVKTSRMITELGITEEDFENYQDEHFLSIGDWVNSQNFSSALFYFGVSSRHPIKKATTLLKEVLNTGAEDYLIKTAYFDPEKDFFNPYIPF